MRKPFQIRTPESEAESEAEAEAEAESDTSSKYTPKGAMHAMNCADIVVGMARGTSSRGAFQWTFGI